MKVKLLLATTCILTLPIFLSPTTGDKHMNSAPFASVALAGHVTSSGAYCPCDGTNCPASRGLQGLQHTSDQPSTDAGTATSDGEVPIGIDFNTGVLSFLLVLIIGLKMRF